MKGSAVRIRRRLLVLVVLQVILIWLCEQGLGRQKIESNIQRDRDTNEILTNAGWVVIRVWEHEETTPTADAIEAAVRARTDLSSRKRPGATGSRNLKR
jgi:G:T-mismatch repair DNA endonuclease (very short patch repair protein)